MATSNSRIRPPLTVEALETRKGDILRQHHQRPGGRNGDISLGQRWHESRAKRRCLPGSLRLCAAPSGQSSKSDDDGLSLSTCATEGSCRRPKLWRNWGNNRVVGMVGSSHQRSSRTSSTPTRSGERPGQEQNSPTSCMHRCPDSASSPHLVLTEGEIVRPTQRESARWINSRTARAWPSAWHSVNESV